MSVAAAMVMDPFAAARPAEVDAQAGMSGVHGEPAGQPVQDLVVEGAAIERMRMEQHGSPPDRRSLGRRTYPGLESPGRAVEEQGFFGGWMHGVTAAGVRGAAEW